MKEGFVRCHACEGTGERVFECPNCVDRTCIDCRVKYSVRYKCGLCGGTGEIPAVGGKRAKRQKQARRT